jgi:membrane-associated protease RseP (regulator of RpoE activity)
MSDDVMSVLTNGYFIALVVFLAYLALVIVLKKKGILARHNASAWGPILMWRTKRGKDAIDWLARPKRFWLIMSVIGMVLCLLVMVFMMGLLIWEATLVSSIPADKAPGPEMILGIPGINPIIPIWYGIIGLIVAIVCHELAHGIMTRVGNMGIKAMGIMLLVVPLGAFVEPEEEELRNASRRKRMNVYAAGPATNIVIAVICMVIFASLMMGSLQPVSENPVVLGVGDGSPLSLAQIGYGSQFMVIGGLYINSTSAFNNVALADAGQNLSVSYVNSGNSYMKQVYSGVCLVSVSRGGPAFKANMTTSMLIYSLNDTKVRSYMDFQNALENTAPYSYVNVTALKYDKTYGVYAVDTSVTRVLLGSRLAEFYGNDTSRAPVGFHDYGYMGITATYMGASVSTASDIKTFLAEPYANMNSPWDFFSRTLRYIALPFQGLAPIQDPIADLFVPGGVFTGMNADVFWFAANCFYWIFWINLMVGFTNVLPAVPLDGGFLFKDGMDSIVLRFRKNATEEERNRLVSSITFALAFFVLFLIIWQFIGPRIV